MTIQEFFETLIEHIDEVVNQKTDLGIKLWQQLLTSHPADIAELLSNINKEYSKTIFTNLPQNLKINVFEYLSNPMKVFCLSFLSDEDRGYLLSNLPLDELTDFLDELSDEELKKYLKLLHKKDRDLVLSLLRFNPDSAGGIMDTDVVTLIQDFTIEKSIQILQRIQPRREVHQQIYVTNQDNELVGHIGLEDLVLKNPKERISSILRKNVLVVDADEDKEIVAQNMLHYKLMTVPVVDKDNNFLGVIPSDTLVDIIEEEAAEDVYHMSALANIKETYFETPFFKLFFQRSSILLILLIAQSLSSLIIKSYEAVLVGFSLVSFITMLTSTGGNTSSQTSAIVITGLASGEINETNMYRFLLREFTMAVFIALTLGIFSFARTYLMHGNILSSFIVSSSLSVIVLVSVMLGSCIPLFLKRFKLDPALSAGPFLATFMDVIGLFIFCTISQLFFQ
ncbi:magnesium transporter [Candidatus Dependentiae bacterium]|nr:magnesium transporter [Candidatus Dependentiae bacterium]